MSNTALEEKIVLTVTATNDLGGLRAWLVELGKIDAAMDRMNAKFSGRTTARNAGQFKSGLTTFGGGLGVENVAKIFGMDPKRIQLAGAQIEDAITKQQKRIQSAIDQGKKSAERGTAEIEKLRSQRFFTSGTAGEFKNIERASAFLAREEGKQSGRAKGLFASGGGGAAPASTGAASVAGVINLVVPASQIIARVEGPIPVTIPGAQITGAGSGGGGAGRGPGGGGSVGGAGIPGGGGGGDLTRREIGTRRIELEEQFKQAKFGLRAGDSVGLARVLQTHSRELSVLADQSAEFEDLSRKFAAQSVTLGTASQSVLAGGPSSKEQQASKSIQRSIDRRQKAEDARAASAERQGTQDLRFENQLRNSLMRQRASMLQMFRGIPSGAVPPPTGIPGAPMVPGSGSGGGRGIGGSRFNRGLAGFTPQGFATNILTVTGWTAAVGSLYAGLGVVSNSVKSFIELEQATKRLQQVFRGGGGSAKELASDVLGLAAANGRTSKEALDASIAWSRAGLNRQQVNEAVRVSLVAANVAELDAAEATGHLSAIYQAYGLRIEDLDGVLGQLNNTSNKFRVTNRDLLEGLSRTSAIARQAKLPLEELIPLIGLSVSQTGGTGAQFGNAIKTLLTRISTPDIQSFLFNRLGVNVSSPTGGIKPANQIFGETVAAFNKKPQSVQQETLVRLGGATQANRIATLFQVYARSIEQATDNLKNLNSAQQENALVMQSLASKLQGLRTNWDRFIFSIGDAPAGELGRVVDTFSGVFRTLSNIASVRIEKGSALEKVFDFATSAGFRSAYRTGINFVTTAGGIFEPGSTVGKFLGLEHGKQDLEGINDALAEYNRLVDEAGQKLAISQMHTLRGMFGSGTAVGHLSGLRSQLETQSGFDSRFEEGAQLKALSNPALFGLAQLQDRRTIAARQAGAEADSFGIGESEGERALNRQRQLLMELYRLSQMKDRTDNDNVRQLVFRLELIKTEAQIQERIVRLAGEEKQIRLEGQREFQKSLLFAGPSDLLRKMAVNQLVGRGKMDAGLFFSLDPEARRDADTLEGGDAMRKNKFEASLLAGLKMDVNGQQRLSELGGAATMDVRGALNSKEQDFYDRLGSLGNVVQVSLTDMSTAAVAAGEALRMLPGYVGMIGEALASLPGASPAPKQAGGLQAAESVGKKILKHVIPFVTF